MQVKATPRALASAVSREDEALVGRVHSWQRDLDCPKRRFGAERAEVDKGIGPWTKTKKRQASSQTAPLYRSAKTSQSEMPTDMARNREKVDRERICARLKSSDRAFAHWSTKPKKTEAGYNRK
jgi:hypothetical protein